MLDLAEIPFFAALSPDSLIRLRGVIPLQHYAQGTIIARVGEQGRYFQAVAAGAVRVQPEADAVGGWRGFVLGPGQIFGEMSLFTGMPISATLIAVQDTVTYCLDGASFLRMLDEEPVLHRSLTRLLIERLRHRTRNDHRKPGLAVVVSSDPKFDSVGFARVLLRGIDYYAPGSQLLGGEANQRVVQVTPDLAAINHWRADASGEQCLLAVVRPEALRALSHLLLPEDVVLDVLPVAGGDDTMSWSLHAGAADFSRVYLGERPRGSPERWSFAVPWREFKRALDDPAPWDATVSPNLDHLARYVTFNEIGVALSSGAARGFAHIGVLEALEAHGIPIDFLCGTSMGGIAALTVANSASAHEGAAKMATFLGGNRKIRDRLRWPTSSVFTGRKVARAAREVFGDATFADLRMPTAVVASDLASGERTVLDSGLVAPAILGTSAIPGFFPPIAHGQRLLVDGAIVSRVPVDILGRRRCGLRIAVNVVALPNDDPQYRSARSSRLQRKMSGFFGLKYVLGASWELLGSHGSNVEALRADIVITPETHSQGGAFDFDRYQAMIDCGRAAAEARIEAIRDSVRALLGARYR